MRSIDRFISECTLGGMRVWISGGTGFLGRHLVRHYISQGCEVVSFSRDEGKHEAQRREISSPLLKSYVGDVRDADTVERSMAGAVAVIHAAAQKHVPWSEEFPEECYRTNVQGTINVERATERLGITQKLQISSDKATKPINTYGASKFMAEQVWRGPVVRLGNLFGSTGSVVYWLLSQRGLPTVKITSTLMRRYSLMADEATRFCSASLHASPGVFSPAMKWYWLKDLCEAVCPGQEIVETGVRKGEKLVEEVEGQRYDEEDRLSIDELRRAAECLGSTEMAVMLRLSGTSSPAS